MKYLVMFPAGASEMVVSVLRASFGPVLECDDSAAIFSTKKPFQADAFPFAKNAFLILAETARGSIDNVTKQLSARVAGTRVSTGRLPFRVMFHVDGGLVPVRPQARKQLEEALAKSTGGTVSSRGDCQEYWVVGRRGWNQMYLASRLPKAKADRLPKGALSDELASLLVHASSPRPSDVFLDPFGGSGSIVAARAGFPAKRVIYNDLRPSDFAISRLKRLRTVSRVEFANWNAEYPPEALAGAVNCIVTDPPWGEFDESIADFRGWLLKTMSGLTKALSPGGGRLVMLVNRRNAEEASHVFSTLGMQGSQPLEILVNGHPATVLRVHWQ